jgi:hypothetical protein
MSGELRKLQNEKVENLYSLSQQFTGGRLLRSNYFSPLRNLDSRNSDWLRAGRPRSRSSSPSRVKNFLFSTSSRPALGPTQPPIQWVSGAVSPR